MLAANLEVEVIEFDAQAQAQRRLGRVGRDQGDMGMVILRLAQQGHSQEQYRTHGDPLPK
jgi:hypothetical protein